MFTVRVRSLGLPNAKVTAEVTKAIDAAGEVLVGRSVGPSEALLRLWNGMPTGHLCKHLQTLLIAGGNIGVFSPTAIFSDRLLTDGSELKLLRQNFNPKRLI